MNEWKSIILLLNKTLSLQFYLKECFKNARDYVNPL